MPRSHPRFPWSQTLATSVSPRLFLLCTLVWTTIICTSVSLFSRQPQKAEAPFLARRLLSTPPNASGYYNEDCKFILSNETLVMHKGPPWETCVFEKQFGLAGKAGFVCLYIFLTIVLFIGMAIICDDFFVPSLEAISEALNLSEDVAGATFMAAGSSAPELFTSITAVTFESDVGVGTITGSAVFNLLVIISLSAAFAGKELLLDWRPLVRDSSFYAVSIGFFIYAVWDTFIQVWEAVILLILYALYIVTMVFNEDLMNLMTKCCLKCCASTVEPTATADSNFHDPSQTGDSESFALRCQTMFQINRRSSVISRGSTRSSDSRIYRHYHRNSLIQGARASISRSIDRKYSFENVRNQVPSPEHNSVSPTSAQRLLNTVPTPPSSPYTQNVPEVAIIGISDSPEVLSDNDDNNNAASSARGALPPLQESSQTNGIIGKGPLPSTPLVSEAADESTSTEIHPKLSKQSEPRISRATIRSEAEEISMETLKEENPDILGMRSSPEDDDDDDDDEEESEAYIECCCDCCPPIRGAPPATEEASDDASKGALIQSCAQLALRWFVFILAFPFIVAFSYTIPDCSKPHNRRFYLLSFFTSVLWIAGISFCMVTVVARTGCLINVDDFVMSLVFLASGTSIPDLLSSIIVAREGFADMAVSNAIGSNVFDINLGLGLPFLIRIISNLGRPYSVFSTRERTAYCRKEMVLLPHPKFGFILLLILLVSLAVFAINRFRLNKGIGTCFFAGYILFLVYAFLQEFLCSKYFNC